MPKPRKLNAVRGNESLLPGAGQAATLLMGAECGWSRVFS